MNITRRINWSRSTGLEEGVAALGWMMGDHLVNSLDL